MSVAYPRGRRYPDISIEDVVIDVDKDWAAKKIENLGAPDTDDDAPRRDTIDDKINTHKGDASAHHAKTTSIGDLTDHDKAAHDALNIDADTVDGAHKTDLESTMDSKITTHKGDASAHHAKTTDAGDITSGRFGKTRLEWTADKLLKGAGVGADPTEIDVPAGATIVRKTADETVKNSTTLQNDDELYLPIGANEVWIFRCYFLHYSQGTPDIKFAWAIPTGATGLWQTENNVATIMSLNTQMVQAGQGADTLSSFWGYIENGANAGNLQLQWAQNTAHASDTKVLDNSVIQAWKIS